MTIHSLKRLLCWAIALNLVAVVAASPDVSSNLVPQIITHPDGTTATILLNRKLKFTRGSEGTRPVRLTNRSPFFAGRDEWCGEVAEDPATDFSASAPLAADCKALVDSLENQNGFWTLQPSDFGGSWVHIASSGTCSFATRYADAGSSASPMKIGTNDIRFYTNRYTVLERNGKLGLQGTVQCNNDVTMLYVTWGLIHSETTA